MGGFGSGSIRISNINQEQITEITKNTEKKIEAFPTAAWKYKELVDVMQQEIRQTRTKKLLDCKEETT